MLENIRYDQRYASLLAVYRCRSYTLAAEKLSLTPSAVSQQIHSVERELGIRLFNTFASEIKFHRIKIERLKVEVEKGRGGVPTNERRY